MASSNQTLLFARSFFPSSYLPFSDPPPGYVTPEFPGLTWPPQTPRIDGSLYYLSDVWRFTIYWTLLLFAIFHAGAATIAITVQLLFGRPAYWLYLWSIPLVYGVVSGVEAICAGTFVGLIVGAAYLAGHFWMSTWIPFVWGWVNLLVILISSFSIQGGL